MQARKLLIAAILVFSLINIDGKAQQKSPKQYNKALADSLGADEYGMKSYYLVLLYRGDKTGISTDSLSILQAGHMANMGVMAASGNLALAGPFIDDTDLRGIFIISAKDSTHLHQLLANDPAIKRGTLVAKTHPWYGSAALMQVGAIHKEIQKTSF